MAFSFIVGTLDRDIAISAVEKISFGKPGASILPPRGPFCQLGDSLGTMGAAGRTHGCLEPDFD